MSKIVGIGDSNLEFMGHGWAKAFEELVEYETLLWCPGDSSIQIRDKILALSDDEIRKVVKSGDTVFINSGVNAIWREEATLACVRSWITMTKRIKQVVPGAKVMWVPSHYTGGWKLEWLRFWIWVGYKCSGVADHWVNLRKENYRDLTVYNFVGGDDDKLHLMRHSYEYLVEEILLQEMPHAL